MFKKPFQIKSNSQMRGTERKKLCEKISTLYQNISNEEIHSIFPKKEPINVTKIVTYNGYTVMLYCMLKTPMFFDIHLDFDVTILLPTVYTLWQYPQLLKTFTTYASIIPKLSCGAYLMLPGLVLDEPVTPNSFGDLPKDAPVSIDTKNNKTPIAVGLTACSSIDMYRAAGRGRCVKILHVVGDALCQMQPVALLRSDLALMDPSQEVASGDLQQGADEIDDLSVEVENQLNLASCVEDETASVEHINETEDIETENLQETVIFKSKEVDPVEEMDKLLEYCFLKACKMMTPNDLPLLSSNFFKNHLLAACPPDKNVDVKKSRHKKLSVFLAYMKSKGIIDTSIMKGVETLLSIKFKHPLLQEFVYNESSNAAESAPTGVSDCYKVTAEVLPVLSKFGYEKDELMNREKIRSCFINYVESENLSEDGRILKLNPQLAQIMRTKADQETLMMEDGINKFIGRMMHMHQINIGGGTSVQIGKIKPIDMRVTMRSNGKKVTLVNNLEMFGINPKEFSKDCQLVGASATVINDSGKKNTPSVLVQGNQILYVNRLLIERYRIQGRFIKGLEFAPKKKK